MSRRARFCAQSSVFTPREGASALKTSSAYTVHQSVVSNFYHGQGCLKVIGYVANGVDYIQITIEPPNAKFADDDNPERHVILYQGPARDFYRDAKSIVLNEKEQAHA